MLLQRRCQLGLPLGALNAHQQAAGHPQHACAWRGEQMCMSVSRGGRVCDRHTKSPLLKRATQLPPNRRLPRGGGGAPSGRSSTATRPRPPSSTMAAAMPCTRTPPRSHHSSSSGLAMCRRQRVREWAAFWAHWLRVFTDNVTKDNLQVETTAREFMHAVAEPPLLPPLRLLRNTEGCLRHCELTVTDHQQPCTQLCNI